MYEKISLSDDLYHSKGFSLRRTLSLSLPLSSPLSLSSSSLKYKITFLFPRLAVFEKGESLSGYYRFFNAHGESIWLQTRATLIIDSRTGKPICVNCMFFVIR